MSNNTNIDDILKSFWKQYCPTKYQNMNEYKLNMKQSDSNMLQETIDFVYDVEPYINSNAMQEMMNKQVKKANKKQRNKARKER
jgi:hypothetical protein